MTPSAISPDDILRRHHPAVQALAQELREFVKRQVPETTERAYPGWHAIGYRHPTSGYFCGLFPFDHHVHLLFEWGVLLPDPEGLLRGDGAQVRYVFLQPGDAIPEEALSALIEAALSLPDSRAARQAMLYSQQKQPPYSD